MADRQGILVGRRLNAVQTYALELLDAIEGAIKCGVVSYDALFPEYKEPVKEVEEADLDNDANEYRDATQLTLDFSSASFDPEQAAKQAVALAAQYASHGSATFGGD